MRAHVHNPARAVVLALGVVLAVAGCTRGGATTAAPPPTEASSPRSARPPTAGSTQPSSDVPTTGTLDPLTAAEARSLQEDLGSGDARRVARAVALPPGLRLPEKALAALDGLQLQILPGSFRDTGEGTAAVRANVTSDGGTVRRWEVGLVRDQGRWRVTATTPVDGP